MQWTPDIRRQGGHQERAKESPRTSCSAFVARHTDVTNSTNHTLHRCKVGLYIARFDLSQLDMSEAFYCPRTAVCFGDMRTVQGQGQFKWLGSTWGKLSPRTLMQGAIWRQISFNDQSAVLCRSGTVQLCAEQCTKLENMVWFLRTVGKNGIFFHFGKNKVYFMVGENIVWFCIFRLAEKKESGVKFSSDRQWSTWCIKIKLSKMLQLLLTYRVPIKKLSQLICLYYWAMIRSQWGVSITNSCAKW